MSGYASTLELVQDLTDDEWNLLASKLLAVWFPRARPEQRRPDGDWSVWLILAGRGWGKTRTGAEDLTESAIAEPGDYFVCSPTFRDMRAVCVEGAKSGLLAVLDRRAVRYEWNLTTTQISLANGSRIYCGSADEPDRWRGYNFRGGWCDEVAAWRRPDTFTQLRLATRVGDRPRIVVTTTPKPTPLLRHLVDDPSTHVTRGSTWDNAANLSEAALEELRRQYEGTRIGRQELEGELLLDTPGALWTLAMFDAEGFRDAAPDDLERVVVAIDPAVTSSETSDESGVVVAGRSGEESWVLEDLSLRAAPQAVARTAVDAYHDLAADRVIVEDNNGADWIPALIATVDPSVRVDKVHASRGKLVRAQPVAGLYEQGRVHHVDVFSALEDQLCGWTPETLRSPDRLDALVWALTALHPELGGGRGRRRSVVASGRAA